MSDVPLGWMCPKCSKVYSPLTTMCEECNKKADEVQKNYDRDYIRSLRIPPRQGRID